MASITLKVGVEIEIENPVVEMTATLMREYSKGNWTDEQKDGWKDIFSDMIVIVDMVMNAAAHVINGQQTTAERIEDLKEEQFFLGMLISDECMFSLIQTGVARLFAGLIK
jgi:hypothetical protein